MGHTPGPWTADTTHPERTLYMVWARDLIIADVVDDQHDNAEANAHLIAAAPDLLVGLKSAVESLVELAQYEEVAKEMVATGWFDDAVKAIAKAEGRGE